MLIGHHYPFNWGGQFTWSTQLTKPNFRDVHRNLAASPLACTILREFWWPTDLSSWAYNSDKHKSNTGKTNNHYLWLTSHHQLQWGERFIWLHFLYLLHKEKSENFLFENNSGFIFTYSRNVYKQGAIKLELRVTQQSNTDENYRTNGDYSFWKVCFGTYQNFP